MEEEGGAVEEIGSVIAKGTNSTTGSCEGAEHVEAGQMSMQGEGSSTNKTNPYSNLSGELAFYKNPNHQGILDLGVVSKTPFGPFPSLNVESPFRVGLNTLWKNRVAQETLRGLLVRIGLKWQVYYPAPPSPSPSTLMWDCLLFSID